MLPLSSLWSQSLHAKSFCAWDRGRGENLLSRSRTSGINQNCGFIFTVVAKMLHLASHKEANTYTNFNECVLVLLPLSNHYHFKGTQYSSPSSVPSSSPQSSSSLLPLQPPSSSSSLLACSSKWSHMLSCPA